MKLVASDTVPTHSEVIAEAVVEALESRQLLSGTSFGHGTLSVTGLADSVNTIHIFPEKGKVNAIVNGVRTRYSPAQVRRLSIVGGAANDVIEIDPTLKIPATVNAGAGDDLVIGGGGNDLLQGGAGNDTIYGNAGNDAINGGAGNDRILGNDGNDSINGAAGNDTMYGQNGRDFFVLVERYDKLVGGKGDAMTVDKHNKPSTPAVGSNSGSNGSKGSTGSTGSTGSNTGGNSSNTPAGIGTPVAVIKALSTTVPVGTSVHVDALSSQLKEGEWNTGDYLWNFGDNGAEENNMKGFNAAHTYDAVGNYTIMLTVINSAGKRDSATMTVHVAAAARKTIYVSNSGSDSNDGTSASAPIKTIAKAESLLDDNVQILFHRGETYNMTAGFQIGNSNVVIGAYGSGTKPQILWTASRDSQTMFTTYSNSKNVTIQDLSINTIYDQDINDDGIPIAIKPGGTNLTVRRNEFLNVMYGMNMNMNPTGVMVQDNTAPLLTGLRKYFAWVQGSHITIVGNYAANSTREHIVRINYVSMVNVSDNDFHNVLVDSSEVVKTALNVQSGEFAYLYNNKLYSDFQVGPLGKTAGLDTKQLRFNYAIGESNEIFDAEMVVNHGAQHITLRDNVVHENNNIAINVDGYDTQYQRGVVDLTLQNNTATNTGTSGTFLEVWGPVAGGLNVIDNLYLAPNLTIGASGTAAVKIASTAFSSFTKIDGNIWPEARTIASYLNGADYMNYVGDDYVVSGFKTIDAWNKLAPVGTDSYRNVTPTNSYSVTVKGVQIGARLAA
ncbi:MAG: PKD domain-containing protein [Tepidisphaeraceae bacterium]